VVVLLGLGHVLADQFRANIVQIAMLISIDGGKVARDVVSAADSAPLKVKVVISRVRIARFNDDWPQH